jgi:tetratricopeptide (TPR) repeat protein
VVEIHPIQEAAQDYEKLAPAHKYFSVGLLHHASGNLDEAEEYYLKSLEEQQDFFMSQYNLAETYVEKEEFEKAKEILEEIQKTQPGFIKATIYYGDVLMSLDEYDEAIDVYKSLLESNKITDHSRIAYVYHNLGLTVYKKGEHDESLTYFLKALENINITTNLLFTNVLFSGIVINLAKTYYKVGMVEKAKTTLQWGIEKDSTNSDFFAVLGTICRAEKELDSAREYLTTSLSLDPFNTLAQSQLKKVEEGDDEHEQ